MKRVRQCFERDGVGVVPLSQGYEALVDIEDLPALAAYNWSVTRSLKKGGAYAQRLTPRDSSGKQRALKMHRVLMSPGPGLVVDHINGNGLDNRRENLRVCAQRDNMKNQAPHRTNKLGIKGVSVYRNRFVAKIRVDGKTIFIGSFPTANEAAAAYRQAANEFHGQFARTA